MDVVRIDKFLWSVRLFKTRNMAADACKKGWILVNKQRTKPSKDVKINDIVSVKNKTIFRDYKIIGMLNSRVGAKLVADFITEITTEEELFKLKIQNEFQKIGTPIRDKDKKGRPTKKERRDIDKYL